MLICRRRPSLALVAAALAGAAVLFPSADPFTAHPGETVVLVAPVVLAGLLWLGWADVRRTSPWAYAGYAAVIVGVVAAAVAFATYMARGRMLWGEVALAAYFVLGWRMAWALWARTVGRCGERYRRWGRRMRRRNGASGRRVWAWLTLLIRPTRWALVLLIFVPLAFGSLIHRFKIGNAPADSELALPPLEEVTFTTDDGLELSGWFIPDGDSDATVVICHGLGANKSNFAAFVLVFQGQGYNTLIFDFRGHGDSAGHTSTFGLFEVADVRAAVDWLKRERPAQSRHVFGLGSSMGAMALVRHAAEDPRVEALVLDSAFASAPLLAHQHLDRIPVLGPVMAELTIASLSLHAGASVWELDARPAIARLSPRPVLLIHGEDDVLIPPRNLPLLYRHAREPKAEWLGPGPHSNVMTTDFGGYERRVIEFLNSMRERE